MLIYKHRDNIKKKFYDSNNCGESVMKCDKK